MKSVATKKYVRTSRRKVARIAKECVQLKVGLVRGKLSVMSQDSARELLDTINSAASNFQQKNQNYNTDDLIIENILVDMGPTMKRIMPRARGSASPIRKKMCHIKVMLKEG